VSAPPTLRSARFRAERERRWRDLDAVVSRVERDGMRTLRPSDATRLPALHRAALASLSVARAISLDRNLVDYLTALCARSFFVVYGTRLRFAASLGEFFRRGFPAAIRRFRAEVAVSALLLLLGVVVGYFATAHDPDRYWSFVSHAMAQDRSPLSTREELRRVLYEPGDVGDLLATLAAFLFQNNAKVGLLCFGLGAALGVPVFVLMFVNGATLGAMAQIHHAQGLALDFWAWILPHGVTELFACVLCGAAGLALGRAVAFPGPCRRLDELTRRGREAGALVLGSIAMFFGAALIEGFFRQLVQSTTVRWSLAGASACGWILYVALAGRGRTVAESSS
jgi:uncharacterized membrane protein SpoIIM required for sporulation